MFILPSVSVVILTVPLAVRSDSQSGGFMLVIGVQLLPAHSPLVVVANAVSFSSCLLSVAPCSSTASYCIALILFTVSHISQPKVLVCFAHQTLHCKMTTALDVV